MTLPEGRKPLLWSDMEFAMPVRADQFNCLSGPHSTWESECRWQTIRAQQAIDEAKALRAENERLRSGIRDYLNGDYKRPVGEVYRDDGKRSKHDICIHERRMYEDCEGCIDLHFEFVLKAALGDDQ